jgi:CRP-like cAMP-binding protein
MAYGVPVTSCENCPCGRASGVGEGGRCPLVDRPRTRGTYVYLEGEPAEKVWFVKRGCVVLSRSRPEAGADAPHRVRGAGSFIGMEALVRDTYLDSAQITDGAILCGASRAAMNAWFRDVAPLRMAFEAVLGANCTDTPRQCKSDGSAAERVARWILGQGVGGDASVPRRTLAGLLGMVPETFSRALGRLAEVRAIEVTRTTLKVRDAPKLRAVAERRLVV